MLFLQDCSKNIFLCKIVMIKNEKIYILVDLRGDTMVPLRDITGASSIFYVKVENTAAMKKLPGEGGRTHPIAQRRNFVDMFSFSGPLRNGFKKKSVCGRTVDNKGLQDFSVLKAVKESGIRWRRIRTILLRKRRMSEFSSSGRPSCTCRLIWKYDIRKVMNDKMLSPCSLREGGSRSCRSLFFFVP